jgi:hypothetical protein
MSAIAGGWIHSEDARARAYFPPRAFGRDTRVSLQDSVVESVAGHGIDWVGEIAKPTYFDLTLPDSVDLTHGRWAVFTRVGGGSHRIGGTLDRVSRRIACSIRQPGFYWVEAVESEAGGSGLTDLRASPRVLVRGSSDRIVISFVLEGPGSVSAAIFNRAGRCVRHLAEGLDMEVGSQVLYWDGRDDSGNRARDGVYLVQVVAGAEKQVQVLSIVD